MNSGIFDDITRVFLADPGSRDPQSWGLFACRSWGPSR